MHEVLHAVWDTGQCGEAGDDEEKLVSILGMQLVQVFRDNPVLAKVIASSGRWLID